MATPPKGKPTITRQGSKGALPNVDTAGRSPKDIYESFIHFLKSPMWVLPVMSFIEQRSLVFDTEPSDENSKLFKEIHGEYKGMVDTLIQCFCEDLGIQPKDVAHALSKADGSAKTPVEQSMLEPAIAAQDYQVFVHMMMRKNIELQLQALQMIEIIYGLIPAVLLPGGPEDMGKNPEDQETIIMIEVMKQSQEEYEKIKNDKAAENVELEKAMKASLTEKQRLEEERQKEQSLLDKALQFPKSVTKPQKKQVQTAVPEPGTASQSEARKNKKVELERSYSQEKKVNAADAASNRPATRQNKTKSLEKKESLELNPVKPRAKGTGEPNTSQIQRPVQEKWAQDDENDDMHQKNIRDMQALLKDKEGDISPEELAKRKQYLLEQRDKLLQLKLDARQKAFNQAESSGKAERPRTARAARSALGGQTGGSVDKEVLAARKALAEKLKSEIGNL